ncbi:MAG: hypothetical protein GY940_40665, partial [bacterium]|nr:hypothetical protein [bacterium]
MVIVMSIVYKLKRKRERLANDQGETGKVARGSSGEGTYQGLDYTYKHFRGSDKAPPYFRITIPCSVSGSFKVKKESKFDRFFKKLGVTIELQTHDPEFDDKFYITTNEILFTRNALERRENRQSIKDMFKLGFNVLTFKGRSLTLTWQRFPRRKEMDTAVMEAAVVQLAVLVGNLPKIHVPEETEKSNWKLKRFAAFAVPGFLLLSGIVFLIIGSKSYTPLDHGKLFVNSLLYSIPLFILFSWTALQLVKGRLTSHYELIAIVLMA